MRVLCVNPTLEGRMHFKEATAPLRGLESVQVMDSLYEASDRLYSGNLFHALYVSSHFEREVIKEFVIGARGSKGGSDSAYMLTLEANHEFDDSYVGECGIDGFIKHPMQSAVLAGSLEKARQIFKKREDARQRSAIEIMISGIMKNVDEAAQKLSGLESIEDEKQNLVQIAKKIRGLTPELRALYYDQLTDRAERAMPSQKTLRTNKSTITYVPPPRIIRK